MKITPVGRGTVLDIRSDKVWSNGHPMVLGQGEWYAIEQWCKKSRIYYSKSGSMISFIYERDVTAFMLRWAS